MAGPRFAVALVVAGGILLALPVAARAASFPTVPVTTLGGTSLTLPAALHAAGSLLVIGFTQRSEKETVVWRKNAEREFAANPRLTVFPVIVLAGIPRIFHGLIVAGIRAGFPRSAWDHFLVAGRDEARWKGAVGWQGPDRAYVLLLDRSGQIVWRRSGPFTPSGGQALAEAVSTLTSATR